MSCKTTGPLLDYQSIVPDNPMAENTENLIPKIEKNDIFEVNSSVLELTSQVFEYKFDLAFSTQDFFG